MLTQKEIKTLMKNKERKGPNGGLLFYKVVTKDYGSLWLTYREDMGLKTPSYKHGKGAYKPGKTVIASEYDTSEGPCGKGLHLLTDLGYAETIAGYSDIGCYASRVMLVEVMPEDIVSDWIWKLRCKKLRVIKEVIRVRSPWKPIKLHTIAA